jgi:hypothetical protein
MEYGSFQLTAKSPGLLTLPWPLRRGLYATEGARAALAYAFTVLRKDHIVSLIHPENRASIRVAERIGETLQGRINHLGREMFCYGLDRATYMRQAAPAMDALALYPG